jgi:peptide/nickel transport system substrate-binding protein
MARGKHRRGLPDLRGYGINHSEELPEMGAFPEKHKGRARKVLAAGGAAALVLTAAACGSSSNNNGGGSGSGSGSGGTKVQGGTATFALPPNAVPNYIFPFTSSSYFSVSNAQYFQYLMYRPLYWFGNGSTPTLNTNLSLADAPTFDGNKVTVTMKGWKWSNGESVTAKDVVFWINMMKAVPSDWGDYTPGGFPDNVSDVTAVSPTELTMEMNKSYNHTWFTSNELSQISPMPKAWDRTANGASDCTDTVSDCSKVYSYLNTEAGSMSTWASSPLWSVVDGPWKLQSFNSSGNSTFVPNAKYSGPVKATLAKFEEFPFTTESSEYNVLQSGGTGGTKIDVGYLPSTDAPATSDPATAGSNPLSGYTLAPQYLWSINYAPINIASTTAMGPVNKQVYYRQVLAYLVNQESVIKGPLHGYGYATVGPVPTIPSTDYIAPELKSANPFVFNLDKAKELLTDHGWKVNPNGESTCETPAKCGEGVKQGQGLSFSLPYATGTSWIESMVQQLKSNAAQVGIKINIEPKPFDSVISVGGGNCVATKASCAWDAVLWGGGWTFSPDYYPTGEALFQTGATANSSAYTDSKNDSLIHQTLTTNSMQPMYDWQNYLSTQVPEVWLPNGVYSLTEITNNLQGVTPQSSTATLNPENWYFTS